MKDKEDMGGKDRYHILNGTNCANTLAKPLSTPLENEMFSEALEESDRVDSLCGQKKTLRLSVAPLCLLLLPDSYKKAPSSSKASSADIGTGTCEEI